MTQRTRPSLGALIYVSAMLMLSLYFAFAAVQGDFGVFKRAEVSSQARVLTAQLEQLQAEVARMENLTTRLSDRYLDLDLLDERARDVLGLIRPDEIVIQ